MNRKKIIGLAVVLLAVVILAGCAPKAEVPEWPSQEELDVIRQAAEAITLPYAELYGLEDMEFVSVEDKEYFAVCLFSSEQYGSLTQEEQVCFLADVLLSVYKQEVFPKESGIASRDFDIEIESGGVRYKHMTSSGSHLLKDGNFVFEMDTIYSDAVSDSLDATMAKINAHLQSSYDTMLEVAKYNPSVCPVCGSRYEEDSLGYILIKDYGYCKGICGQKLRDVKGNDWSFQDGN